MSLFEFTLEKGGASVVRTVPYGGEVRCVVGHRQMNTICLSCKSCPVYKNHWRRGNRIRVGVDTSHLRGTGPKYRTAYEQYNASYAKLSEKVKQNAKTQYQTALY
jgi:hypothetical protein